MEITFKSDRIESFKASWPCNHIPELSEITFEMESNGDLVDIVALDANGEYVDSAEFDGPALLALSDDARRDVLNL